MTLPTAGTAAAAGTPFTLDGRASASDPAVAVDENGVGHFAWEENVPYVSQQQPGPDILRYCQVPRNGTACTRPAQFTLGRDAFHAPRVLLPGDGRVLILAHRCCGDSLQLVESLDGGSSWSAPRSVGTVEPSGDAEYGPGQFSASVITSIVTGGVFYQAVPLDGYTSARANVGDYGRGINNPFAYGDLAFSNPLTPIAVMTDLERVYFRSWSGFGDYNDLGSWGPLQDYGPGSETEAAGGKGGVFMTYRTNEFPRRYRMARWGGMSFGGSSPVTPRGDPIFGDLSQDRGGNVHFLWQENGPDELRHRMSRDGERWSDAEKLADSGDGGLYNLHHGAARDGGGFAVWDENGKGPVRAVQFGPTGAVKDLPQDESCVLELKVGGARILARGGCLKRRPGTKKYVTKGDVRVNGIDLETAIGSGSARTAARAKIVVHKGARTLVTDGKVEAKVGPVVLDRAKLSWKLPKGGGQITDLAGNPASFDTGKIKGVEVLKLPVSGQTSPKLTKDGGVEMPVNLKLPDPFNGLLGLGPDITGDATLRADNGKGLDLSNMVVRGENIGLGFAEIDDLEIKYVDDPWELTGTATLLLPLIGSEFDGSFGLLDGEFSFGSVTYNAQPQSQGIPVASGVYLRSLGVQVARKPTRVGGTAAVVGLGTFAGTPVLQIGGQASYTFTNPGVFRIDANAKLIGLNVGNAFFKYVTPATATFGGTFGVGTPGVLGIWGTAGGGFDLGKGKFDLFGEATACGLGICGEAGWIVSSKAAAICITQSTGGIGDAIGTGDPAATVAYEWGSGLDAFWGCNLGKYKAVSSAHAAQDGARTFNVAEGAPLVGVEVVGQGAPPRVTLTGPGGQTIASPADQRGLVDTEVGALAADFSDSTTAVALRTPQAGRWTVTPHEGSVPVTGLRKADAIPRPRVTARVRGSGFRRKLAYSVRPIPGQRVRFIERGRRAHATIGTAKGRRGEIAFTSASGARGRRSVIAIVEQDGVPRARIAAASYRAPGLIKPARPRKLRLARRRNGLLVRWRRAARARSYIVRAALRDGRRLTIPSRRRRVRIRKVPGIDSGRVWVHGVTRESTVGPPKRAKLKAKPKKLRKKRRSRR